MTGRQTVPTMDDPHMHADMAELSGLSGLALLVYQGGITLAAGSVARFLTLPVLSTLTASGGLLIAAIGMDLLGLKRLPVGNLLPGVFIAAALAHLFG